MSIRKAILLALPLSLAASVAARAGCHYDAFAFYPDRNDRVTVPTVVDAGDSCSHNFRQGPGYRFTGVAVEGMPQHGRLSQTDPYRFVYASGRGYAGPDRYVLRVCATKEGRQGCSRITYAISVR